MKKVQIVTWGDPFSPDKPLKYGLKVGRAHVVTRQKNGTYKPALYPSREIAANHAKDMRKRLKAKEATAQAG